MYYMDIPHSWPSVWPRRGPHRAAEVPPHTAGARQAGGRKGGGGGRRPMYPREASVGTSSHSVPVYTMMWTLCVEYPNPTLNE